MRIIIISSNDLIFKLKVFFIYPGGEDGQIKIWSRSGMLRSKIIQEATPIYSATWSPDSNQILFTSNKMLVIKSLSGNTKSNRVRLDFINKIKILYFI